MLDKQDFVAAIECIRVHDKLQNDFNNALNVIDNTSKGFVSLYEKYNTLVIKLLKSNLGISQENDWIEYFIYDLDFGTKFKLGCVIESDGKAIDLSTPAALYDYIREYYLCTA